jgi:hypothetical protein
MLKKLLKLWSIAAGESWHFIAVFGSVRGIQFYTYSIQPTVVQYTTIQRYGLLTLVLTQV